MKILYKGQTIKDDSKLDFLDIFPIGSVYEIAIKDRTNPSVDYLTPAEKFGGTWELIEDNDCRDLVTYIMITNEDIQSPILGDTWQTAVNRKLASGSYATIGIHNNGRALRVAVTGNSIRQFEILRSDYNNADDLTDKYLNIIWTGKTSGADTNARVITAGRLQTGIPSSPTADFNIYNTINGNKGTVWGTYTPSGTWNGNSRSVSFTDTYSGWNGSSVTAVDGILGACVSNMTFGRCHNAERNWQGTGWIHAANSGTVLKVHKAQVWLEGEGLPGYALNQNNINLTWSVLLKIHENFSTSDNSIIKSGVKRWKRTA